MVQRTPMVVAIVIYISMPVENGIYDAFDCGRDEKIVLTQELRTFNVWWFKA